MNWDELTTADKARELVPKLPAAAQKARLYLAGDYWQGSRAWVGTQVPADARNRLVLEDALERQFVPQPILEEILERHVAGVVGREPVIEFVLRRSLAEEGDLVDGEEQTEDEQPTPQEATDLAEVNATVASWAEARNLHDLAQEFAATLRSQGRAVMRYWVPPGLLNEGGELGTNDWKEALSKIYIENPAIESATVQRDRDTMQPVSVFAYKEKVDGKDEEVNRVEISFRNQQGQTVVRILQEDVIVEDGEAVQETGGELYVYESELKPLLTAPVQQMQNALNVINSMILRNGDLAGFRERNYINLQPPTKEIDDPKNPGQKKEVTDDLEVGASAANFLTGIVYEDQDGNEKVAAGSVIITDPVDPSPLISAKETFEHNIYQATSQLHVLISGDATASAVSRVQARADFIESLLKTKPKVEGVLRSRLQGALVLAAWLAGDNARVERFKDLRARVECRINAGPLAPDERRALLEMYDKRVISLETAQAMLGIDDVQAEVAKLREEEEHSEALKTKRATTVKALTDAGLALVPAARLAGYDEDDVQQIQSGEWEEAE